MSSSYPTGELLRLQWMNARISLECWPPLKLTSCPPTGDEPEPDAIVT